MQELRGRDATYSFLRKMTVEKALMGRKRGGGQEIFSEDSIYGRIFCQRSVNRFG